MAALLVFNCYIFKRVIEIRIKEHEKYVYCKQAEKSEVAELVKQKEHNIHLNEAKILNKEQNQGKRMIKEAINRNASR